MDETSAFLAELDDLVARGLVDVEDEHDEPRFRSNALALVEVGLDELATCWRSAPASGPRE